VRHIEAVVFDMDGVLVDAREWHYLALNKALGLFGYSISPEEHEADFDGLPTRKKLEMLSERNALPIQMHDFINVLKQNYTVDLIHKFCRPTFKHEYALKKLKDDNFKIGLASNSISPTIELMMQKTSLDKYLDEFVSADSVSTGKPAPEIYEKLFEKLNVTACKVVVLEDNENGIQAATLAGAHVLTVKNPSEVDLDRIRDFIEGLEVNNCKP
jgi:beta-phosphoglucomutase-like phosphatase (HAD superfamily)